MCVCVCVYKYITVGHIFGYFVKNTSNAKNKYKEDDIVKSAFHYRLIGGSGGKSDEKSGQLENVLRGGGGVFLGDRR